MPIKINPMPLSNPLLVTKSMLKDLANEGFFEDILITPDTDFSDFHNDQFRQRAKERLDQETKDMNDDQVQEKYREICAEQIMEYCLFHYQSFKITNRNELYGIVDDKENLIFEFNDDNAWRDAHMFDPRRTSTLD